MCFKHLNISVKYKYVIYCNVKNKINSMKHYLVNKSLALMIKTPQIKYVWQLRKIKYENMWTSKCLSKQLSDFLVENHLRQRNVWRSGLTPVSASQLCHRNHQQSPHVSFPSVVVHANLGHLLAAVRESV